jgi:hypothetical protein
MNFNTETPLPEAGLGLQTADDIAVVGYSFKLPQGIEDDYSFWEVLQDRRNLSTEWPASRINIDSFMDGKSHTVCTTLSHTLELYAHHFHSSMAAGHTSLMKMSLPLTLLSFL